MPGPAVVDHRREAEQPAPVRARSDEQPRRRPLDEVRIHRLADRDDAPVDAAAPRRARAGRSRRPRPNAGCRRRRRTRCAILSATTPDARRAASGVVRSTCVVPSSTTRIRRPVGGLARVREPLAVRRPGEVAHVGGRYRRRRRVEARRCSSRRRADDVDRRRAAARRDEREPAAATRRSGSTPLASLGAIAHRWCRPAAARAGSAAVRRPARCRRARPSGDHDGPHSSTFGVDIEPAAGRSRRRWPSRDRRCGRTRSSSRRASTRRPAHRASNGVRVPSGAIATIAAPLATSIRASRGSGLEERAAAAVGGDQTPSSRASRAVCAPSSGCAARRWRAEIGGGLGERCDRAHADVVVVEHARASAPASPT